MSFIAYILVAILKKTMPNRTDTVIVMMKRTMLCSGFFQ